MNCKRDLDILNVILGNRKHLFGIVVNTGKSCTSALIGKLKILINNRPAVSFNGSGSENIPPAVKLAVDNDAAAVFSFDPADRSAGRSGAGRPAAGPENSSAYAYRSVDSYGNVFRNRQCPENSRSDINVAGAARRSRIDRCSVITRNEKRLSGRYGKRTLPRASRKCSVFIYYQDPVVSGRRDPQIEAVIKCSESTFNIINRAACVHKDCSDRVILQTLVAE